MVTSPATAKRRAGSSPSEDASAPAGRLRILMVTPRYLPYMGGVESHVAQVAQRLARAGVEVTVLTADTTGQLPAVEQVEGVRVERVRAWPPDRDFYFAPDLYRVISGPRRWDLLHVQSYHTLVPPLAMWAARRAHLPYVVTFHGGGHSSRLRHALRTTQRQMLRPLLAQAERLIAVANFEIDLFGRELRLPRERFALIPNGCDLPPLTTPPVRSPNDGPLIASVGRLEKYKGHQRILAALPHILQAEPGARLWIAGVGPYEPELRRLAQTLGVAERVEIRAIPAADRQAMAAELARASLFVLLSEYETHPIAALEALSLGCPVLVADSSGLAELAERGLARAVSLQSTSPQVAAAALEQLRHPLALPPLELPTWDDCAAGLLSLYHSILARPACAS